MAGTPSWTPQEFERLLNTLSWSRATLARRLPGRSLAEIAHLRVAIHAYHAFDDPTGLEPWMVVRLTARRGSIICAVCDRLF